MVGAARTVTDQPWMMWTSAALTINSSTPSPIDLEQLLGPRRFELYKVVPITVIYAVIFVTSSCDVIYAVIFVTGVVGNVCTAVVIVRHKYMHTATNYYLCNLVLSDLLVLAMQALLQSRSVCSFVRLSRAGTVTKLSRLQSTNLLVLALGLPVETYSFWSAYPWIFGETFCVLRTMAAETSTNASILTITAFTVERYVAICHPMRAKTMSSLSRAVKTIIVVWIVSTPSVSQRTRAA